MRAALLALGCLVVASTALAQDPAAGSDCHPVSPTSRVVVTMDDGTRVGGTLLCLGEQVMTLAAGGLIATRPLAGVRRIATPSDGVLDGLLKGAAIGAIIAGVLCLECDADYRTQALLGYALMGVAFDALHSHSRTIYEGAPRRAALGVRVRF
jgi:hypothetical protein